jgi:hypothetical protein
LFGQSGIQINGMDVTAGADEASDASTPYVIFSNLGPKNDAYNPTDFEAIPIVGRKVNQTPEEWIAIRFVPKVDVQATVIEAAVGWTAGKKLIQLGIYTNDDTFQTPGTLLPGGQGSTNDIPDLGQCCQLTKVTLPGPGATLTANTIYWLVCSTDDVHGVSFNGAWQVSRSAATGALGPPNPWVSDPGQWPAARISGTRQETLGPVRTEKQGATLKTDTAGRRVRIFSNLNPIFLSPYTPGFGLSVQGNTVPFTIEAWRALPFTPKTNVNATTFSAGISHSSGTNQISLGVWSDSDGLPGTPLPGGQATIINLPNSGDCCDFATLRIPEGISLIGGTKYWLVASPDDVNAPDFAGLWQISTNNLCAELFPEQSSLWTLFTGYWIAAQITGQSE